MFARVLRTVVQEGKAPEAVRIVTESIAPAAKEQRGNRGFVLLTDGEVGLIISFWETRDDLTESDQNGYLQAQIAKAATLLSAPPLVDVYQVELAELTTA
jgi:heme-degrading monooxygenase HmoA